MHAHPIPPFDELEARNGVLVVDGYGIALRVQAGHLVVSDGSGRSRRERRYPRVHHGLTRVVIVGTTGYITLEAVRWLDDLKIPLIHLTADGTRPLATTTTPSGADDGRLRRAQALAHITGAAVSIARQLLHDKIDGQNRVAARLGRDGALDSYLRELDDASTTDQLMKIEADAARSYWGAWADVPVVFREADQPRVPEHWTTVGPRSSPLTSKSGRHAVSPAHAALNYMLALAAAEARIACHAFGLDPSLGVLHSDKASRDSLVYDLIEPIRPSAEGLLLTMLRDRAFSSRDFTETRDGACRVGRGLTDELATATAPLWIQAIYDTAGRTVKQLADNADAHIGISGRLGESTTPRSRLGPSGLSEYRNEIAPKLRGLTAREIAEATGLSIHYTKKIRNGIYIPHQRHWANLRNLIDYGAVKRDRAEEDEGPRRRVGGTQCVR